MKYNKVISFDELEAAREMMLHAGYKSLEKLFAIIEDDHAEKVLTADLTKGSEALLVAKARHEGIRYFIKEVRAHRTNLIKPTKKE